MTAMLGLGLGGSHFRPFLKILSPQALDVSCVTVCDGDAAKNLAHALENLGLVSKGSVKKALQKNRLIEDVLEPGRWVVYLPAADN